MQCAPLMSNNDKLAPLMEKHIYQGGVYALHEVLAADVLPDVHKQPVCQDRVAKDW